MSTWRCGPSAVVEVPDDREQEEIPFKNRRSGCRYSLFQKPTVNQIGDNRVSTSWHSAVKISNCGRYAAAAPIEIRSEHSTAFGKSIAITRSQLQSFPTRSTL
ncbi:hypothetical protein CGCA056_v001800 [Colletotrichum aenigma]|uniref:uncharacterized protein n=1 Tax=Colletotrichum aenigma TaxID=1215731 RepID=UPI0018725131|nr:uncharacterized protein CGCA056_v001800 [Colletotrichum aenigma]KAF5527855.1 hypothetical protein CGCA056_v001800 [Colletotrichum aenigma]